MGPDLRGLISKIFFEFFLSLKNPEGVHRVRVRIVPRALGPLLQRYVPQIVITHPPSVLVQADPQAPDGQIKK